MLKIKLVPDGIIPVRRMDSAGYDCFPRVSGTINPLSRARIPLGFAAEFPDSMVALLLDKSGVGNRGVTRMGGVVDSSYRDEWQAILYNSTHEPYHFEPSKAIIQVVFVPFFDLKIVTVDELTGSTRGAAGFGSTGLSERLEKLGFHLIGPISQEIVDWSLNPDPKNIPSGLKSSMI